MSQLEVSENKFVPETKPYVPSLQRTEGQPPPIAANGGLSYMSFDRGGDAGTGKALEDALGDGIKRVEENERDAAIVQRRSVRLKRALPAGTVLAASDLVCLRPAPAGSIAPSRMGAVLGRRLTREKVEGAELRHEDVGGEG